jgi:hypothetical protein
MPDKPTLYVCSVDQGGFKQHPCRQSHEALSKAGIDHDKIVHAKSHPLGLFTE